MSLLEAEQDKVPSLRSNPNPNPIPIPNPNPNPNPNEVRTELEETHAALGRAQSELEEVRGQ